MRGKRAKMIRKVAARHEIDAKLVKKVARRAEFKGWPIKHLGLVAAEARFLWERGKL